MRTEQAPLDLSHATSPLYVRQAVALFLGLPLDREFTWDFFSERISSCPELALPRQLIVHGLPRLSTAFPEEASKLVDWLRDLGTLHPEMSVDFVIHD
ncbi:hypothetical protein IB278_33340 [Variovorax sp. VRV01]|uniref:hypothetical protein n=1 Tax=Variovorax sp. VRV01 TaxID=2769259 RepID=UPI0017870B16|nr:hypothetical protein [Variovorax sp. VRV01]MBD9668851.1 hypothetical protein [Variovorax sp. VRV01]